MRHSMNLQATQQQFLDLLNEHKRILYKLAYVHCRRTEDRKDLIQEMLIQLWRSYESFDGRVKFSTWLYRVAANTAISFYRHEHHAGQETISIDDIGFDIEAADSVFGESNESMQILRSLIDQMDELNSTLILLYLDGYSHEDIASTIGISVSNVGTRINRIKQKLKESLKE
jgi:RNA polymerase sigma factor (sigma-70 family)